MVRDGGYKMLVEFWDLFPLCWRCGFAQRVDWTPLSSSWLFGIICAGGVWDWNWKKVGVAEVGWGSNFSAASSLLISLESVSYLARGNQPCQP